MKSKLSQRISRHKKIRAKVSGSASLPRLSVFRSNRFMYAQLIDDDKGVTIVSASDFGAKKKGKLVRAGEVGRMIAEKAKAQSITKIVFDRGGFSYRGRIKALADGAREGGLIF